MTGHTLYKQIHFKGIVGQNVYFILNIYKNLTFLCLTEIKWIP